MKYYIIAGEASGDLHGSKLIEGLLIKDPSAVIRFWGGEKMLAAWEGRGFDGDVSRHWETAHGEGLRHSDANVGTGVIRHSDAEHEVRSEESDPTVILNPEPAEGEESHATPDPSVAALPQDDALRHSDAEQSAAKNLVHPSHSDAEGEESRPPEGGLVVDYRKTAVMGFKEVVKKSGEIFRRLRFCKKDILAFCPDVVVFIDYPGFNLRIAEWAHKKGFKTAYYIAPKVWASREGRVKKLRKYIDRLIIIFPFEIPYFDSKGIKADYVGCPLVDIVHETLRHSNTNVDVATIRHSNAEQSGAKNLVHPCHSEAEGEESHATLDPSVATLPQDDALRHSDAEQSGAKNLAHLRHSDAKHEVRSEESRTIALLAGSRTHEIKSMMRPLQDFARGLLAKYPDYRFIIAAAPNRTEKDYPIAENLQDKISIAFSRTYEVIRSADLAIVNSGTASLETLILGTPQVVGYILDSNLLFSIGRHFLKVKYISLGNLCANKLIFKELLQKECTGENLLKEALHILEDPQYRTQMLSDYADVMKMLQNNNHPAAHRAAEICHSLSETVSSTQDNQTL